MCHYMSGPASIAAGKRYDRIYARARDLTPIIMKRDDIDKYNAEVRAWYEAEREIDAVKTVPDVKRKESV